ncbi:MAG TPA: acyl-CoA--6-aminopenicillanic acid acyl-transferase [Candidatus Pullichristensenella excrementigallinarum]|uniref:Acyl-CoA--6-aminopenicillanic acid acyl-transferase n=1 Tax=Candidatus Pullichristensenella excrementigallinarum TaxID=2840907 RepID=A0A9D1LCQ3_9FIRM|nr:acyl-CoA--6-aminopenicillanic acid acyl-transferase [Candidatus Pullichristensenella excrementigallinarum]
MRHLNLSGDPYSMGVAQGKIFQRNVQSFPLRLDPFQREHGKKSERILREFFPEACAEMRGVSDTIGAEYTDFSAWMLCMGCCMYNLEENIPIETRGCTAFAYSKQGRILFGRNNDLPPYLKDTCASELYSPTNANRFSLATSSFIQGEEGINEQGLTVAMTFVMTDLEKIEPGFNACFAVRYLLEKSDTVRKAIALLMELPIASNCNLLLADPTGEMAVVECAPTAKTIRKPVGTDGNRIVCAANRFVCEEMRPYAATAGNDYDSQKRYNVVLGSFPGRFEKADPIEATRRLLRGEYGFMCQYDSDPNFETVWSSIFDLKHLRIYRAEGDPRNEEFVADNALRDLMWPGKEFEQKTTAGR